MTKHAFAAALAALLFSAASSLLPATETRVWIPGWQLTHPLSTPRAGAATVVANGVIYILGGVDGRQYLRSTEYAPIRDNGTLGPWRPASPLHEPRAFFAAVVHEGVIYAVGGGNDHPDEPLLRTVERAVILPDGSLGPWQKEHGTLQLPRRCVKLVRHNQRLYALGGFAGTLLDSVETTTIEPDGTLAPWQLLNETLSVPRYVHAAKNTHGTLVVLGGHKEQSAAADDTLEYALFQNDGSLGPWQSGAALRTGRYGHGALVFKEHLYALGGISGATYLSSVEKSRLDQHGRPGPWQDTSPLPSARANFSSVAYGNFLYVIGGTNQGGYYNTVEYTSANSRGDLGFWGSKQAAHQYEKQQRRLRSASPGRDLHTAGTVTATVDRVINAGGYSYLQVTTSSDRREWLAVSASGFKQGDTVEYRGGMLMRNFYSRSLDQTFPEIRFVSQIQHGSSAP